ncbi:MAG: T9SS type A sorting domain-containing protein [Saprospiraceae bacterium]|nr:T9SS type A sorting domain-containing protein [Saprospiraceae bacterium]
MKHIQTLDGGFVILGNRIQKDTEYYPQIYVFKINANGKIIWQYLYDDPESVMDDAYDLAMDRDGNILLACKRTTYYKVIGFDLVAEDADYLVLKLSPSGQLIWKTLIPGKNNKINRAQSIVCDSFGNSYTAGVMEEDVTFDLGSAYLNKLDSAGNIVWELEIPDKRIGNLRLQKNMLELALSKKGTTFLRFDLDGNLIDYSNSLEGSASSIKADHYGNIYTTGFLGNFQFFKHFSDFSLSYTYQKPTLLPGPGLANEVKNYFVSKDTQIYLTGRFYGKNVSDSTKNTLCDLLTVKLDANGTVIWEDLYKYDYKRTCQIGNHVTVDEQGRTIVTGYQSVTQNGDLLASRNMVVLIYDPDGNRVDSIYHNGPANKKDSGIYSKIDGDDLYLFGWSQNEDDLYDHAIIKYSKKTTSTVPAANSLPYTIFPNPGPADHLTIHCPADHQTVSVFDIHGQCICSTQVGSGTQQIDFPMTLPSGMYTVLIGSSRDQISLKYLVY